VCRAFRLPSAGRTCTTIRNTYEQVIDEKVDRFLVAPAGCFEALDLFRELLQILLDHLQALPRHVGLNGSLRGERSPQHLVPVLRHNEMDQRRVVQQPHGLVQKGQLALERTQLSQPGLQAAHCGY